jgi:cytochrome P450
LKGGEIVYIPLVTLTSKTLEINHRDLTNRVNQALTPGRVKDLEPRIRHIVDELLAQVQPHGSMECMADFALPLPVIVIAEWLGVPPEDHDTFHAWSNHMVTGFDAVRRSEAHVKHTQEATLALGQYLADLIRRRRQQPRDDLISALTLARDAQDRLTEDELLAMCMVLLIAGHETTVNLLGNGALTLLRHPTQLALLKHHPELLPSAVEEMLRCESPVQRATFRFTAETFEIGGRTLDKGQQVSAVLGAANRDPAQFPQPDTCDLTRQPNRHLACGRGMHFCLGAPLARTEARIGFARLHAQRPHLQLVSQTLDWSTNTFFRGLRALPVTW